MNCLRDASRSIADRTRLLLSHFQTGCYVLVFDNFESALASDNTIGDDNLRSFVDVCLATEHTLRLYSLGQALVVPNFVAGPSYGVVMVILFALRVGAEERLMLEHFGKDYEVYMARTKRLVPGVW